MKFVQLSDAREKFEELFEEVERGETLVITRGDLSAKSSAEMDEEARQQWIIAMRDLRDLKKGAGIATIDELLKWREETRRAARKRWKAPKLWTDLVRPRPVTNARELS